MAFEGKVRAFLEHFDKLEASNGSDGPEVGYYKEFMELEGLSQQYIDNDSFPADSGKLPCNKKKNRFKDILPFEHTRVVLHPEEDVEGSDYINANYITDAKGDIPYIASQGPLPHTVNDFWRMIWYHNIEVVVMACREYEMGIHKCERYWPDKGEIKMFGPIKVTTISENNVSNDFVIREIQAECQGDTQKMRQYHYNAWPDHLKPTAVYPIIRMIEVVHEKRTRHEVPIVVHCSAGCGQTGTIIAIDIFRSIILNKDAASELSVFGIVKSMRMQRPAMVQAKDQYHFVYQAAFMIAKNVLDGKKSLQKPPVSNKWIGFTRLDPDSIEPGLMNHGPCLKNKGLTTAQKMVLLQEKVSRLEVAVREKKGVATTQSGGVSQGDSEEIRALQQHLATQGQQLASQKQQLATQERQLATQEQQLATQERQLSQQKRLTQNIQQQFQALLQQVEFRMQTLQPSWSIAQHHLQITAQVLGRGAWGEVRVGIYQGTRVAVKKMHDVIISDHNRELFEREMVIASKVRHPHLVLFIGAVTTGNLTIVSELMETSLRKLLEEKKLKVSNLRPISKDVACALAYLHSLPDPIVHRDVSSANVLLYAKQDGWCAKLSDFGSANFLAKLGTVAPGAVIYSAPEALHPRQQGPKMDVYSFGILLFEMCVGKLIDQHNLQTTKAAVANWPDREKKFLGEFALRCTETNPDKRPNMANFVK